MRRLYVDGFKSLSKFELRPGPLLFLAGDHGAGKSSVLEALRLFRRFVFRRQPVSELLRQETVTRWDGEARQTFGMTLEDRCGLLDYSLVVEQGEGGPRVARERLACDGALVVDNRGGEVRHRVGEELVDAAVALDADRSSIAPLAGRFDQEPVARLLARISRLYVVQLQPQVMQDVAMAENRHPSATMFNFAPWWRHLARREPSRTRRIEEELRGAIEGFRLLRLVGRGDRDRRLVAELAGRGDDERASTAYRLSELSDGERSLVALFALLHVDPEDGAVLCIDAPERFLTTRTLRLWLQAAERMAAEGPLQLIVAAQYPELLDEVDAAWGLWLDRRPSSPTRSARLADEPGQLSLADAVARRAGRAR